MIELQDIFLACGDDFRRSNKLSYEQSKVMTAIERCRTSALGGHLDYCPECGFSKPSYNSCRNRHCPKCQAFSKERWIDARKADLLNVQYFHVVFTVPAELYSVFYSNQRLCYNLLFHCASETLRELSADKKYLGASIGLTGEVKIDTLIATSDINIAGGAGKITISDGALHNLDLEMGVGQLNLTSLLSGNCDFESGVGEANITVTSDKSNYNLDLKNGIGKITVDGTSVSNFQSQNNGSNSIKISGGIGAINLTFKEP